MRWQKLRENAERMPRMSNASRLISLYIGLFEEKLMESIFTDFWHPFSSVSTWVNLLTQWMGKVAHLTHQEANGGTVLRIETKHFNAYF